MSLRSPLLRLAPAFVVALVLLLVPSFARAQMVTIAVPTAVTMPPSLERLNSDHQTIQKRNPALNPEAVNLQDCHDNQYIRFPLVIMGTGTGTLTGQVWATEGSSDCSQVQQRQTGGGASGQCYRLPANFIITPTQNVDVAVKDLIKGLPSSSSTVDAQGCRLTTQTSVSVWFLALSGDTNNGSTSVPITVSTQGPTALSGIKALPGDTRITVSWDTVGEGGVTNVLGVQAYCDGPDPAPTGASDASTRQVCTDANPDADIEAGETSEPSCTTVTDSDGAAGAPIPDQSGIGSPGVSCSTKNLPSTSSKPLVPDSTLDPYKCGSVTGTGNTLVVSEINGVPLVNGKTYAVAVAATDTFGNIGDVSTPLCQFPETTSDFWRDYKNAGGSAGGGFCSIEGAGMPAGSFGVLVLGIAIGVSAVRRRVQVRRKSR